jgi:hypothetical protein
VVILLRTTKAKPNDTYFMPLNFLGKLIFPKLAPWQRQKQTKIILLVVGISVLFAAIVGAIILLQNNRH